jgi:ubiquitin carboxyl-terminal hydrolase 48
VDITQRQVSFSVAGGSRVQQQYDLLVGADGAGSEVRKALQQHYPDMQVTIDDSGREYKVYGGVRGDIEPEGERPGTTQAAVWGSAAWGTAATYA